MNKNGLILILAIFFVNCNNNSNNNGLSNSNLEEDEFVLKGNISTCKECIISIAYDGINGPVNDSIKANEGWFEFSGQLAEPQLVELAYSSDKSINIFLANREFSEIEIDALDQSYTVKKGQTPSDYLRYKEITSSLDLEIQKTDEQYGKALESGDVATNSLEALIHGLQEKKQEMVKNFVIANPSSQVGVYAIITTYYSRFNVDWLEEALMSLDTTIQKQKDWIYLNREVLGPAKATEVGKKPPQFDMIDIEGKRLNLDEFKGKVVLIDFWASWCVPCRVKNKELVDIYTKYKNRGFEIIGISLDGKEENWRSASLKDNISWVNFCDLKAFSNKAAASYGIKAIPSSFLLDQQGIVIGKNLERNKLIEKLDEYLAL